VTYEVLVFDVSLLLPRRLLLLLVVVMVVVVVVVLVVVVTLLVGIVVERCDVARSFMSLRGW